MYASPLLLLILMQIRFSAYQSLLMTSWHFLCVTVDSIFLLLYWRSISTAKEDFSHQEALVSRSVVCNQTMPAIPQRDACFFWGSCTCLVASFGQFEFFVFCG